MSYVHITLFLNRQIINDLNPPDDNSRFHLYAAVFLGFRRPIFVAYVDSLCVSWLTNLLDSTIGVLHPDFVILAMKFLCLFPHRRRWWTSVWSSCGSKPNERVMNILNFT